MTSCRPRRPRQLCPPCRRLSAPHVLTRRVSARTERNRRAYRAGERTYHRRSSATVARREIIRPLGRPYVAPLGRTAGTVHSVRTRMSRAQPMPLLLHRPLCVGLYHSPPPRPALPRSSRHLCPSAPPVARTPSPRRKHGPLLFPYRNRLPQPPSASVSPRPSTEGSASQPGRATHSHHPPALRAAGYSVAFGLRPPLHRTFGRANLLAHQSRPGEGHRSSAHVTGGRPMAGQAAQRSALQRGRAGAAPRGDARAAG
jgi:hypothetical protein